MNLQAHQYLIEKTPIIVDKNKQFLIDVLDGLSGHPKQLLSKYFYDKKGDQLFQQIMACPDYYLTRCEMDIFQNKTNEIAETILFDDSPFDLIELGAGDATKSVFLLEYLKNKKVDFSYMPIDISSNILSILNDNLEKKLPNLNVVPLEGEYFEMLSKASKLSARRKVILFLGSNIGNMELSDAHDFCKQLRKKMNKGDVALIGFDLKKHPQTILNAYNDREGITAAFNLNLLERINAECNANFNLKQFEHYQSYDPLTGACKSYLISLKHQNVLINGQQFDFKKNELIYMEVSQKFSITDIENLAVASGFTPFHTIEDSKLWYMDSFWLAT